ncbi:MAG TPA: hypothetical protein VFV86_12870 [Nitrososphaeraceae archaeon]|nr:hypothetical protein [Nitrososphaeraceae archaeon]
MVNKNLVNNSSSRHGKSLNASQQLINSYNDFLSKSIKLFPKVDHKLLLDMIHFQTNYKDWEGSVLLRIVYSSNSGVNTDKKKEEIFQKYQKMPEEVKENRTLRVKLIRMYIENLEELINSDNDIEFISGSATLTPSDAYSDSP